jgi:hypothetical protein
MRERVIDYPVGGRLMLTLILPVLLQFPNPLQLFEDDELKVNVVVLVCAYAIGATTANVTAAIAPTARIVAKIGIILFIVTLSYKLLIKDIVILEIY